MSREGVLWIGGLEPYMNADFLRNGLSLMGEEGVSVRILNNKFTGDPSAYGVIRFDSDPTALMALHKLNNKIIPHSQPPVRFQLTHAGGADVAAAVTGKRSKVAKEFSLWVMELTREVTQDQLEKCFSTRYESIKKVKIIHEGKPPNDKTYGFVRFSDQTDHRDALIHMNFFRGLGEKTIKVSQAVPKFSLRSAIIDDNQQQYAEMYAQYGDNQAAWNNYGSMAGVPGGERAPVITSGTGGPTQEELEFFDGPDDDRLIEHNVPLNVDALNSEFITRSEDVWDGIERDRWIYNLDDMDNEDSIVPKFRTAKQLTTADADVDQDDD